MDAMWFDRTAADKRFDGVDDHELQYDPDTGLYCLGGEPFTGVSKLRHTDGNLHALTEFQGGVAHGVSVAWFPNGQIELYSEMDDDVYHGWHIEWDENGTRLVEQYYREGRLCRRPGAN